MKQLIVLTLVTTLFTQASEHPPRRVDTVVATSTTGTLVRSTTYDPASGAPNTELHNNRYSNQEWATKSARTGTARALPALDVALTREAAARDTTTPATDSSSKS